MRERKEVRLSVCEARKIIYLRVSFQIETDQK